MKQLLLAIGILPLAVSALEVPTTEQPRVALLEEFTGVNCGNCPDGHRVAARIMAAQPELFIPVSVHAGGYATPRADQPDFTTAFGEALNSYFLITSYPSGIVNRLPWKNQQMVTRSEWSNASRAITRQTSPVNIACEATFDLAKRELTVEVGGHFTADCSAMTDLGLNVYLLESGILGPQAGGLSGNEYVHRHMLRDLLTPDWGEAITGEAAGKGFTRTYKYTVPREFKEVACEPERLSLVAFVTRGRNEVVTATRCFPACAAFPTVAAATIGAPRIPVGSAYGYTFLPVEVTSEMIPDITSLTFETCANGGAVHRATVDCLIHREASVEVEVPIESFEPLNINNMVSVKLVEINGTAVDTEGLRVSFDAPKTTCGKELSVTIRTDDNAADNRFLIRDANGKTVAEFGPYADGAAADYTETVTLPASGLYCLEVTDAWADGMLSPRGFVKIHDSEGNLVAQNLDIKEWGSRMFFTATGDDNTALEAIGAPQCAPMTFDRASLTVTGATDVVILTPAGAVAGRGASLASLPSGLYIATGLLADGTRATLKIAL